MVGSLNLLFLQTTSLARQIIVDVILSGTNVFSGIGFAIPSNTITKIIPSNTITKIIPSNTITKIVPILIQNGYYPHPFLGLVFGTLTSDLAQDNGIPLNLNGLYVNTITKNDPADKAGIHGSTIDEYSKKHLGDIIMAVEGRNVTKSDDLINYIADHKIVGNDLTLTLYRNGHPINLKVTLSTRSLGNINICHQISLVIISEFWHH